MKHCLKINQCLFLKVFALLLLFGLQAQGRIYVVTDTSDTTKITSLRGAIIDANSHGGNNTIILGQRHSRGFYRLTISGADEDAARTGDLDITRGSLTISGVGPSVTIDATGLGDRVFQVFSNAQLTLKNLTITGGTSPAGNYGLYPFDGEDGGAIYNAGTLLMMNCVIAGNTSGVGGIPMGNIGGANGGNGGGIYNTGVLNMSFCTVTGNSSGDGADFGGDSGNGGGIYNAGSLALDNCIISSNSCGDGGIAGGLGGSGGGIYNANGLNMQNCTINNNIAGAGGDGGEYSFKGNGGNGGGIYNTSQLDLINCTLSGNSAGRGGIGGAGQPFLLDGGIIEVPIGPDRGGDGGDGGAGGGIYSSGVLTLISCTISDNSAGIGGVGAPGNPVGGNGGNGGSGGSGGGVFDTGFGACVHFCNTLIALNSLGDAGAGGAGDLGDPNANIPPGSNGSDGSEGLGPDLAGVFASQGFNLIGMSDGSTGFTNGVKADQIGSIASPIDPLIGPLQMNGGPTPTHALLPGSPAIDQGKSFGVHTDQRGYRRPYNYTAIPNAPGGDGSDIGAFELGAH